MTIAIDSIAPRYHPTTSMSTMTEITIHEIDMVAYNAVIIFKVENINTIDAKAIDIIVPSIAPDTKFF